MNFKEFQLDTISVVFSLSYFGSFILCLFLLFIDYINVLNATNKEERKIQKLILEGDKNKMVEFLYSIPMLLILLILLSLNIIKY